MSLPDLGAPAVVLNTEDFPDILPQAPGGREGARMAESECPASIPRPRQLGPEGKCPSPSLPAPLTTLPPTPPKRVTETQVVVSGLASGRTQPRSGSRLRAASAGGEGRAQVDDDEASLLARGRARPPARSFSQIPPRQGDEWPSKGILAYES